MATTTGFVYKLVCKDVNFTEIYIGSSISLRNRRSKHKSDCSNVNSKSYNLPVYQYVRNSGGWANWELQVVEQFEFEFKFELVARERHHMETLHATLNACVPGRTPAGYRAENVDKIKIQKAGYRAENLDKIKIQQAGYRANNVDKIKAQTAGYYAENKDKIKAQQAGYRAENVDKIKAQTAGYRANNKDKLKEKHDCPCGGRFTHASKSRHMKNDHHRNYEVGKQMYEAKFGNH